MREGALLFYECACMAPRVSDVGFAPTFFFGIAKTCVATIACGFINTRRKRLRCSVDVRVRNREAGNRALASCTCNGLTFRCRTTLQTMPCALFDASIPTRYNVVCGLMFRLRACLRMKSGLLRSRAMQYSETLGNPLLRTARRALLRKGRTRYPYVVYRWLPKLTAYIQDAMAQHKPQLRNAGVIYAIVAADSARDALEEYRAANLTYSFPNGFSDPSFTISIASGAKVHD
jgi:hypothetical protein